MNVIVGSALALASSVFLIHASWTTLQTSPTAFSYTTVNTFTVDFLAALIESFLAYYKKYAFPLDKKIFKLFNEAFMAAGPIFFAAFKIAIFPAYTPPAAVPHVTIVMIAPTTAKTIFIAISKIAPLQLSASIAQAPIPQFTIPILLQLL